MTRPLRIAILAHSTNPRGGVAHALAVAEAFTRLGHDAVVHAPDVTGAGFFRPALCRTIPIPASPVGPALHDLVETRIAEYIRYFEDPAHRRFDIFHAQDGISGNALASLKQRGLIPAFVRTVHHIDSFTDDRIATLQTRSIVEADRCFVVSRLWRDVLARDFRITATPVGNGVDRDVFSPTAGREDRDLRQRLRLGAGPIVLAVGGVEPRKNTLAILKAFGQILAIHPAAQLVIAGGASLLDHSAYQTAFRTELERSGDVAARVILTGPINQNDMPALYRAADALVFPSVQEGFGLAAIEAIACGTPVVTSRIPPFTEHFAQGEVVWCDPRSPGSIADAMALAVQPHARTNLARRIDAILAPHSWARTAAAHLPAYRQIREVEHA
ncbi:glycosyltransferase-like protein [Inquilinus ginsengisoli]|uniref:Glycosyltransferase-like protein n=1 Tax=Inquilinus ginsengisoli TaxID=363840 RepID=A0ABU1JS79_9PROT|nr:MSMEG_0565 family glycosyltransferase [Inquilinus ginsengisoli]MDR6291482.1 glycosyltransferase-like protein [Inquilinus ginsengisoli]